MSRTQLMLHCGGQPATLDQLQEVQMPQATRTYTPLSHYDYAMNVQTIACDLLEPKGHKFLDAGFGLAKGVGKDGLPGARMFGVMRFSSGNGSDYSMAVGIRNSYDKSMKAAFCIGASVFVCDNLCFSGDIVVMRKHTGKIVSDIVQAIVAGVYKAAASFQTFHQDVEAMKDIGITERQGYEFLGWMFGMGVLTPTLFTTACRQWTQPSYDDFAPRTAWSLYNATTHALKKAPATRTFELHRQLHTTVANEFNLASGQVIEGTLE